MKRQDTAAQPRDRLLPKLTMWFFRRTRTAALLWFIIAAFGITSYVTLLKREGFPSVNVPLVTVNGVYAVNDPAAVDKVLAEPISRIANEQPGVQKVTTQSQANFFFAALQFEEDADANAAKKRLQAEINNKLDLPANAQVTYAVPYFGVTGGGTGSDEKVDATVSVYSRDNQLSLNQLYEQAEALTTQLNRQKPDQIQKFSTANPFETVTNPLTGQAETLQRTFDRYAETGSGKDVFHDSVIINVASVNRADVIELDNQIREALARVERQDQFRQIDTAVSASYAPAIKEQISELQRVLLEGLIAVLIIGSLIIAVRASVITVIAMATVLSATVGLLYLLDYSLNVITLFALILGLSLIVDDTIIMVEAIDAARRKTKSRTQAVREATRKISRAMVAATLTAALSFAPLLFVGGILGSFIRAIPVTIISALLISLLVALIFIPLFAKFILLGDKQMGQDGAEHGITGFEHKIARLIARPMLWAKGRRLKEFGVGILAVLIGLGFIVAGGTIFRQVDFNIFPPTKDTNEIALTLQFPAGTSTEQAETLATNADNQTARVLGDNLVRASYFGLANDQTATLFITLKPYDERKVTAPQLVEKLESAINRQGDVKADAYSIDAGPPQAGFTVNIKAQDRAAAIRLANDMAGYLEGRKLTRTSGEKATITESSVNNTQQYDRSDNQPIVKVTSTFDGTDISALTILAQDEVEKQYTNAELATYGLSTKDISFDIGQESENQDSFNTLAIAFPAVLLVIYLLLAVQFRSLLQPLLIFLALPFSFFGIALALYLSDNPFSFFAMLGFFALIGLSIKNTILLTDYANQARRAGLGPIDAAVAALGERFRPLVATSLTAVVSLIPLALTSPFWEGLTFVLIGGLLSSTFLVITVFPYYYLGAEYIRIQSRRLYRWAWRPKSRA